MPSSHVYADGSAGFIRYQVSDGTHSHIQRVHLSIANVDNTVDPGSPTGPASLINPENEVNKTARNFLAMMAVVHKSTYNLSLLDFQGVSGGAPSGPPIPLLPYVLAGDVTGSDIPEAQVTETFRDTDGAPCSVRWFGGGTYWDPTTRVNLAPSWSVADFNALAAYLVGIVKSSSPTVPAGLTKVVSHHGLAFSVALHRVSGLNNRLRREYRVK